MITVNKKKTVDLDEEHGITLTNLTCSGISYECKISVGSTPGITIKKDLGLGDVVLFQTENFGLKEIRVFEIDFEKIIVKVKNVSPPSTLLGIAPDSIVEQGSISEEELQAYVSNMNKLKEKFSNDPKLSSEEFSSLSAQIDYLIAFSRKDNISKKDLILQTMGLVCNLSVAALFAPDVAQDIFISFTNSIPWFVDSVVHSSSLLSSNKPPSLSK